MGAKKSSKDKTITNLGLHTNYLLCLSLVLMSLNVSLSTESVGHFHCGRWGQECLNNGVCNGTSGFCECVPPLGSYDCSFDTSSNNKSSASCQKKCENGACYKTASGAEGCVCTPDYFGDLCDQNRVDVNCAGSMLKIKFEPIQKFDGIVFIGEDVNKSPCHLNREPLGVYSGMFNQSKDCGSYQDSLSKIFETTLHIFYNDMFYDDNDLKVEIRCVVSANDTVEFDLNKIGGEIQQLEVIEEVFVPASLKVLTNPAMTELSGPVLLGQRVFLWNHLDNIVFFKRLYVHSCTATDPDNSKTVDIIKDGCPAAKAKKLFFSNALEMDKDNTTGILHDIKVFQLDTRTTNLTLSCRVVLCADSKDPNCDPAKCAFTPMSRRRRSVSDESYTSKEKDISTSISIKLPPRPLLTGNGMPRIQSNLSFITTVLTISLVQWTAAILLK